MLDTNNEIPLQVFILTYSVSEFTVKRGYNDQGYNELFRPPTLWTLTLFSGPIRGR
jgi:hypothetical protein